MELWKIFGFSNYLQNQQIKDQLSADSNKPKCPHCGGPAEQGYTRCKNCGQEIAWVGNVVCKPENLSRVKAEAENARLLANKIRFQERRREAKWKPYKKWLWIISIGLNILVWWWIFSM